MPETLSRTSERAQVEQMLDRTPSGPAGSCSRASPGLVRRRSDVRRLRALAGLDEANCLAGKYHGHGVHLAAFHG